MNISSFSPRTYSIVDMGQNAIKDIAYEKYKSDTGGGDPVEYTGVKKLAMNNDFNLQSVDKFVS